MVRESDQVASSVFAARASFIQMSRWLNIQADGLSANLTCQGEVVKEGITLVRGHDGSRSEQTFSSGRLEENLTSRKLLRQSKIAANAARWPDQFHAAATTVLRR